MSTDLEAAVQSYPKSKKLSRAINVAYTSTLKKWDSWGNGIRIERLRRKDIRSFLDWVYEHVVDDVFIDR